MSKCTEIRDFLGDYAFDVEYSRDNKFTMFFNSRRNAEIVKRCIEIDDSVPNAATPVDFVEVVRCKDCRKRYIGECPMTYIQPPNSFCRYGERKVKE